MQSSTFMETLVEKINDLYDNRSFLDKNGDSILMALVIIFIFVLIITYLHIKINLKSIRADWINQRCMPNIIPFAGMIVQQPNMSALEYTEVNFAQCTQMILTDISDAALMPFYYIINVFTYLLSIIISVMNDMRILFYKIRNSVSNVTSDVMGRILNIISPLIQYIIAVKDMLGKTNGIMTASMYTLFGIYFAIKSAIGNIMTFIIIFLIALAIAVVLLFFIPFVGLALGAVGLAFFIAIAIPMANLIEFSERVLKQSPSTSKRIPKNPNPG